MRPLKMEHKTVHFHLQQARKNGNRRKVMKIYREWLEAKMERLPTIEDYNYTADLDAKYQEIRDQDEEELRNIIDERLMPVGDENEKRKHKADDSCDEHDVLNHDEGRDTTDR